MAAKQFYDRCCNPFNIEYHLKKNNLRKVCTRLQLKHSLDANVRLCSSCLKKLRTCDSIVHPFNESAITDDFETQQSVDCNVAVRSESFTHDVVSSNTDSQSSVSEQILSQPLSGLSLEFTLPEINQVLESLYLKPIYPHQFDDKLFLNQKADEVALTLKKKFFGNMIHELLCQVNSNDAVEIIQKLKNKFSDERTTRDEMIQILTILPSTWSVSKTSGIMNSTEYMVRCAKNLEETEGVLSKPGARSGKPLSKQIESSILQFYEDDEISAPMPGMKDCISIRNDEGQKIKIQKRLILSNLNELHTLFKERNPTLKVGFSKFASLRPKNCILAGGSGTHTVCVCSVHQNVKLMMLGCQMSSLTKDQEIKLCNYDDCIKAIVCPTSTSKCFFGGCDACPRIDVLHELLEKVMEEQGIETVHFSQWVSTPRTSLQKLSQNTFEFIADFCTKITDLMPHNFIAKQQASYLRYLKDSLKDDEFIVICDFAENYAFIIQDAAPGFHWNNNQSTIYTVVIYFKENNMLLHKSLVIISDCMAHDAVAVHVYTKIVVDYIKSLSTNPKKVYYFSDGAPQQYKNLKNFVNLYYHEADFKIPAEWHFFATAHGKGPCDGVGGTLKRKAARASLQLPPDKQITDPSELYQWASQKNNLPNVVVKYSSKDDYALMSAILSDRFENTKPLKDTQKMHCVIPGTNKTMIVKRYSHSTDFKTQTILKPTINPRKRTRNQR